MCSMLRTTALFSLIVFIDLLGVCQGYDDSHPSVSPACRPSHCYGEWTAWSRMYNPQADPPGIEKLRCSTASGHFPLGTSVPVSLPLVYEGNFDLCKTFQDARFCTIMIPNVMLNFYPMGPFLLGQCLSRDCNISALKDGFVSQLESIVYHILKAIGHEKDIPGVEAMIAILADSVQIRCEDDVEHKLDGVGWMTVVICSILLITTLVATVLSIRHSYDTLDKLRNEEEDANASTVGAESSSAGQQTKGMVTQWFAADHNFTRLFAEMPGDFQVLNGIRFLSMVWVITGHTMLMYQNVINPTAQARFLRSFGFSFVRAAEWAVDTFFLLSGFLATWAVVNALQRYDGKLSARFYLRSVVARYLRLTPVYLLMMLLTWKVLPVLGDGPFWNDSMLFTDKACTDNWYYNILYINNILPWEKGTASCVGWTWYLANDFQFFLLVPIIATSFLSGSHRQAAVSDRQASQTAACMPSKQRIIFWTLKWFPCLLLICSQLLITALEMNALEGGQHGNVPSQSNLFQYRVYFRPWCRVTPYATGILLALIHYERVNSYKQQPQGSGVESQSDSESLLDPNTSSAAVGATTNTTASSWKTIASSVTLVRSALLVAIISLFLSSASFFSQFQCQDTPHECDVWFSQYLYGFFTSSNWPRWLDILWYSAGYLVWSLGLALMIYILACAEEDVAHRYDWLRLRVFLGAKVFTPLARLTYGAYLFHLVIMTWVSSSERYIGRWSTLRVFVLDTSGYVLFAYGLSLAFYLICEKPIMNAVATLFNRGSDLNRTQVSNNEQSTYRRLD